MGRREKEWRARVEAKLECPAYEQTRWHPSNKKGTLRQCEKVWVDFVGFCEKYTKRAMSFEAKDVANFATKMFENGATGSAVNAAITALDETRGVVDPSLPPLVKCNLSRN